MFMELPVSGLHRLFNTIAPSSISDRDQASLESVTEEAHTRALLYTTCEATVNAQGHGPVSHADPACLSTITSVFDEWANLEPNPDNIRVLVAQDGSATSQHPRLLYDSQAIWPSSRPWGSSGPTRCEHTKAAPPHDPPRSVPNGATEDTIQEVRSASSSRPGRSQVLEGDVPVQVSLKHEKSGAFTKARPHKNIYRSNIDDTETSQTRLARECQERMNTLLGCMFGFSDLPLVSSTKIHIDPLVPVSRTWDGGITPKPHAAGSRPRSPKKRTSMNRSMTSEDLQRSTNPSSFTDAHHSVPSALRPSILVTRVFSVERPKSVVSEPANSNQSSVEQSEGGPPQATTEKIKQVKIPRYAVSLVLRIPSTKPVQQDSSYRSNMPTEGSFEEYHDSRMHPVLELGMSTTDHEVERITAHWSVLTRVLSSLERVARAEIQRLLLEADDHEASQLAAGSETKAPNPASIPRQSKPKQSSQRIVQLPGSALQQSHKVAAAAGMASYRVSYAMTICRVVAGQGRWGVWRDETEWVSRWANDKEQNFFLFNLLTAFLGNHTEWLDQMGLGWNERRQVQQDIEEAHPIQRRTVIIATDRMAARRLIFLLSAFLPGTSSTARKGRLDHPHSSRSSSGISQSPPFGAPLSREVSLRRRINRRPRDQGTRHQVQRHERAVSFSTPDSPTDEDQMIKLLGHHRRTSEAQSVRSLALPIPLSTQSTRKSSISTVSVPIHSSDVPKPHFSGLTSDKLGTSAAPRPGSSGSLASLSLRRTLSRSDSSGALSPESPTTSRWGSMLSGFWSVGRASSTEGTEGLASPTDGLGILGLPYSSSPRSPSKLARMVEDAAHRPSIAGESDQDTPQGPPSPGTITEATPAKDIPQRQMPEEFPLKLSVDTNDGVVEVDLPASKSHSSSYASSIGSHHMMNTASSSFNDHSSLYGRTSAHSSLSPENDSSVDVAGYLRRCHPDFALQSVRPYPNLKEEIKRSMQDEPTPPSRATDEWIGICTTLIADTSSFTVTRLSLHRNKHDEAKFTEEPLMDLDPTLVDAIERIVVGPSYDPIDARSSSYDGQNSPSHETPRNGCKKVIMSALEDVAKSVAKEQESEGRGRNTITEARRGSGPRVDSSLREGVRRWLKERTEG